LHAQLGFLDQMDGKSDEAVKEYRQALEEDAFNSLAAGDLALIEAQRHNAREAIRLWGDVFAHDPSQLKAGMNLAVTECGQGERDEALATLERMLLFSPDDGLARSFAAEIRAGRRGCGR
jgi:tetratricopeptide (TPR) repeat protein